jgi:hypothetical protein
MTLSINTKLPLISLGTAYKPLCSVSIHSATVAQNIACSSSSRDVSVYTSKNLNDV